ncbi:mitochondrial ribosome-associated GTPase 1-like [Dysidea avara]|uniref:mitochondrial ribosome-associated GTPase 1-like n=1 Tax=Dysidea avara TaxID=196820 RepID=UPI003319E415
MSKGIQQIMGRGRRCDVVLEIHDARVPVSGRNPRLGQLLGGKQRMLVLNKIDLADDKCTKKFVTALRHRGNHKVFAVVSKVQYDEYIKKEILPCMIDLAGGVVPNKGISIMVLGTPNIGKSSLLMP